MPSPGPLFHIRQRDTPITIVMKQTPSRVLGIAKPNSGVLVKHYLINIRIYSERRNLGGGGGGVCTPLLHG